MVDTFSIKDVVDIISNVIGTIPVWLVLFERYHSNKKEDSSMSNKQADES